MVVKGLRSDKYTDQLGYVSKCLQSLRLAFFGFPFPRYPRLGMFLVIDF